VWTSGCSFLDLRNPGARAMHMASPEVRRVVDVTEARRGRSCHRRPQRKCPAPRILRGFRCRGPVFPGVPKGRTPASRLEYGGADRNCVQKDYPDQHRHAWVSAAKWRLSRAGASAPGTQAKWPGAP
jgi:hypothetical protein